MNKKTLKIFKYFFIILFVFLILLIIIPFFLLKGTIPLIWGENKDLTDIVFSSGINLLIGLIASSALSYYTALISFQSEIKKAEQLYLSDVFHIELICNQTVTSDTIDQIVFFLVEYQQRQEGFIESKMYKKRFSRKQIDKAKIEKAIESINKTTEEIKEICFRILQADHFIRFHQDQYILYFSQFVSFSETDDNNKTKTALQHQMSEIEALKEEIADKIYDLSLKTVLLSKECLCLKECFK